MAPAVALVIESVMALPEAQVCVVVCGTLKVKRAAAAPLVSAAVPVVRVPKVMAPQVRVIGLRAYVPVLFVDSQSCTGIVTPAPPVMVTADCKTGLKAHEMVVFALISTKVAATVGIARFRCPVVMVSRQRYKGLLPYLPPFR